MKGGDILIECLKAQGVRCIFGMPGTQNIQIYDSLLRRGTGIEHFLVRHEYSATHMADGFARSTGEVGVALTVPGPGASNASTGILEAFTDCVPVLLITGQSDSKFYTKHPSKMFHGLDQMQFFKPAYNEVLWNPEDGQRGSRCRRKRFPGNAIRSSWSRCAGIPHGHHHRNGECDCPTESQTAPGSPARRRRHQISSENTQSGKNAHLICWVRSCSR